MKFNRRDFLKVSAAAAAAATAPQIITGKARAATPLFGQIKHVLVLFTRGGMRSHPIWNAVGDPTQHNPFKRLQDVGTVAPGTQWEPGALYHDASGVEGFQDYDLSAGATGAIVPGFHNITNDIAVAPCVDHQPGGTPDVNHDTATQRAATGDPYGLTGLLSMVGKHHANYVNGFDTANPPPVEVQATEFGLGAGDYAATRPLTVSGPEGFAANLPIGEGWKIDARTRLNTRFQDRRSRAYRARISEFMLHKTNTANFAAMLQDPRLNVIADPTGTDAGVTNEQILEVLGNHMLNQPHDVHANEPTDMQAIQSWGPDIAMALRFFSFGVPVVAVTRSIYDMHDQERSSYRPRVLDYARQFAGLNYLLKIMPHPDGGTYWDHTLVTSIGEFSRNNTLAGTGFNSGNGSDHVTFEPGPGRNQAIPFMGGPVVANGAGGKVLGATDANINATGQVFSSRSWLSTILDGVGIDHTQFWPDAPIDGIYTP